MPINEHNTGKICADNPVIYLSAEFGFDSRLPIYAGGLGILAGDFMKQAADDGLNVIGVGLLYRGTKMKQFLSDSGWQEEMDKNFDPLACDLQPVFLNGQPLFLTISINYDLIWLRVWKKVFGQSSVLYLLDSNIEQNQVAVRNLTRDLYQGDEEYQLKQQLILGLGAIELISSLQIAPSFYHLNEGRGVFIHLPLILSAMRQFGMTYEQALAYTKSMIVYTNHTLEKAGNLDYSLDLSRKLFAPFAQAMKQDIQTILSLGMTSDKRYSPTQAALQVSHIVNGVSQPHTQLSRQAFPHENWVNVTNGVHHLTWQDSLIKDSSDDQSLWRNHLTLKTKLKEYVYSRTGYTYDENRLVITWARRIAGYKRLDALFADIDRLAQILTNPAMPVQLLIAGKAHQGSDDDKKILKNILDYFNKQLNGYALYIPDYDLELAQHLTRGSDIWINIPVAGKEACGTSGMKAISNGVLQMTVADGWTSEVDWSNIGWVLNSDDVSEIFYQTLEQKVVPLYYQHTSQGFNPDWIKMMQNSIQLSYKYSAKRMLAEYCQYLYQ